MAKVMLNNNNKVQILLDWKNNTANRANELFFITEDINSKELMEFCFERKILIHFETIDTVISKITFIDELI